MEDESKSPSALEVISSMGKSLINKVTYTLTFSYAGTTTIRKSFGVESLRDMDEVDIGIGEINPTFGNATKGAVLGSLLGFATTSFLNASAYHLFCNLGKAEATDAHSFLRHYLTGALITTGTQLASASYEMLRSWYFAEKDKLVRNSLN